MTSKWNFLIECLKTRGTKLSHDKYPPQLRVFAITLHFYSAKAYAYVNKFNSVLPHPRVIRSWYSSVNADPGFSQEAFNSLKQKSEIITEWRKVSLYTYIINDEMSIKKGCQRGRDHVIRGHVDICSSLPEDDPSELPECKDALVFMVVPLKNNWKLLIAYFLIKGLPAFTKSHLIKQALIRLHDVGV